MIEKKEVAEAVPKLKIFSAMLLDVTKKKGNSTTILVRTVHISLAGPRTRRLPTGKHGASGVEKPQETRSQAVAPRRKVGFPDRQLSGGETSKVRCRSRCSANCSILSVEHPAQAKSVSLGLLYRPGLWRSSLPLCSWLPPPSSAHRKALARKAPVPKLGLTTQLARFPARSICRVAKNQPARWPSA